MTARGRKELLCGLGALVCGLLPLAVAYLQPHGYYSDTSSSWLAFSPGFTPIETPYIIAVALPIVGVAIGAAIHSLTRSAHAFPVRLVSASARLLLWGATGLLALEAVIGLIDLLGLLLAPSLALGICASLLARDARSPAAQPTMHTVAM